MSVPAPAAPPPDPAPSMLPAAPRGVLAALYELTKPGIALYVMIVTGAAYYVGAAGSPDWLRVFCTVLGTGLATGGALALNQVQEREVDGRMARTRSRPLPSGRLQVRPAFTFAAGLLGTGLTLLLVSVGWFAAGLAALSAVAYNLVYTPLKSRSYAATPAGAVPGALPALIGWVSATGSVDLGGWVLFGIAYLWQMPHVLGLAWILRSDYLAVGFRMTPPSDPEGRVIGAHMILYSAALLPVSLLPTLLGLTGAVYLFGALVLGGGLLALSAIAARHMSNQAARRVFLASLIYQPLLLGLMLIDTVRI